MTQIWALRSRLEKQPTDLRRRHHYLRDGALVALLIGLLVAGGPAFADEKSAIEAPAPAKQNQAPLWAVEVISDYTAPSKINHSGSFGPQAVFHYQLEALRNVRLTDKYYFQFGVVSEQFIFSRSNSLYPYSISSMAGELSLAYWTGDDFYPLLKFDARCLLHPRLYHQKFL